jgi:hypothetical protein
MAPFPPRPARRDPDAAEEFALSADLRLWR